MPVYVHRSELPHPVREVFAWHGRPGAFERLTPPWQDVRVEQRSGGIADGARTTLRVGLGPFHVRWEARHEGYVLGRQFRDVQERGPFARWVHTHRFLPGEAADDCLLEDEVDWRLPWWALGPLGPNRLVRTQLPKLFRLRHERTRQDLNRHARFAAHGPQHVALTGASGLVGHRLGAFLTSGGHRVHRLRRGGRGQEPTDIRWDPAHGHLDPADLEGLDAVVHLAGENIAGGRWNEARRSAIRESRVQGTRLLARTLAGLAKKPRVLVCASAVGYYGDGGDAVLDESAPAGEGFLPEVCRAWEDACEPARQAGIRVVNLRIGMVLAGDGGALARMLPPFRLGLGGPVGNGRQYMSWIALEDLVGAIHHALFTDELTGPVNATAPAPETNSDFTHTLGRVLRRPTVLPVPAVALRLGLGEMADELLLVSQRVVPHRLQASGFAHLYPHLEEALRSELGRYRALADAV